MSHSSPLIRPWIKEYYNEPENEMFVMPPKVVYRYLSFTRAKQVIDEKKLWFSSPNMFNDPFDMYDSLIDFTINKQRAKDFANRVREGQSRSVRRSVAQDAVRRQEELIRYQRGLFADTKSISGVCCFSKRFDVSLMWSHYADSHRGVVIGFNIDPVRVDVDPFFFFQPVRYAAEVKSKNFYDDKERAIMHWILTKSDVWKYEEEVRAFCLHKNGLVDFSQNCVKEIYFGCNTNAEDRKAVVALTKEHGYKCTAFKIMKINPRTFNLRTVKL